jgi:DNA sulfur modification protein DndD
MILSEIIIENYLCYYGVKPFEFSKGLNIILGENGEGKTKFFEAVDWLFRGENSNLDRLVSAKAFAEATVGDQFKVRVSLTAEQYTEKRTLTKSFVVKKLEGGKCQTSNFFLEGIEETTT